MEIKIFEPIKSFKVENVDSFIKERFKIGFEFEFYLNTDDFSQILKSLGEELNFSIGIPFKEKSYLLYNHKTKEIDKYINPKFLKDGKSENEFFTYSNIQTKNYNSTFEDDVFILTNDRSGGLNMFEFVTKPLNYSKALEVLEKTLNYVKNFGYTKRNSALHINISVDSKTLKISELKNMNVLKFVLNFDETEIFKVFMKDDYGAKSIHHLLFMFNAINSNKNLNSISLKDLESFLNGFLDYTISHSNNKLELKKYFGVNFSKLIKNYIEFRYQKGTDYENKLTETKKLIDYYISFLYSLLKQNQSEYNPIEKETIDELLKFYRLVFECSSNLNVFKRKFPNIQLMVDLKPNDELVKILMNENRNIMCSVITSLFQSELKNNSKAIINFDQDTSRVQLYGFDLKNLYILKNDDTDYRINFDLVKCKLDGGITLFSNIYQTKINNQIIFFSNIMDGNDFEKCKIQKVDFSGISNFSKCAIHIKQENNFTFKKNTKDFKHLNLELYRESDLMFLKGNFRNECFVITTFISLENVKKDKSSIIYYFDFDKNEFVEMK